MNTVPQRKSNRLKNYNYSQNGGYFITICTKDSKCILSQIVGDTSVEENSVGDGSCVGATIGRPQVILTDIGQIVKTKIEKIQTVYYGIKVDKYVIMPNHVHLLIMIDIENGRPMVAPTVSRIINQLKGAVTKEANVPIWQKGFHDHIIRNKDDYLTRWQYIDENPKKWLIGKDKYYSL